MRLKHFTIPALDSTSGEEDLNRFLAAHRILNIERQFIQNGTHSHWCYAINYQELDDRPAQVKQRGKVDYKELLSERDFAIYSRLRDLRKRLAEQEGVPVYALISRWRNPMAPGAIVARGGCPAKPHRWAAQSVVTEGYPRGVGA
jgi:hypothetical protein